jgi:hypothetical protein
MNMGNNINAYKAAAIVMIVNHMAGSWSPTQSYWELVICARVGGVLAVQ